MPALFQILHELGYSQPILLPLDLDRDNKEFAGTVRSGVKLVNFDLTNAFHFRAKMILEGIGNAFTEKIDQTVIAYPGQNSLLISQFKPAHDSGMAS